MRHGQRQTRAVQLARYWQTELATRLGEQSQSDHGRFIDLFLTDDPNRLFLGRSLDRSGAWKWIGMKPDSFLDGHHWTTGSSGAGKSFHALAVLWQLIQQGNPIVIVDCKGELADLVLDLLLPSLSFKVTLPEVRVIQPFSDNVPLLRLTEAEPGVSREIQALNLAASLQDALGSDLGHRMSRVFLKMVLLCIELRLELPVLSRWLANPPLFIKDSQKSADPDFREYGRVGFSREGNSSIEALSARLDNFFSLSEVRLALSAPSCLSFSDCLKSGITVVDVGNPPAGAERAAHFWAGVLIGRLSRAIMGRKVAETTPRSLVLIDEVQEGLQASSVEHFSRLLSQARFKRISLWLANQAVSQLTSVDPILPKLLRTNVSTEMIFRCSYEDAKVLGPALFRPEGRSKSETAERQAQDLTRLPDRHFYFWPKKAGCGAHQVRSPRLDIQNLKDTSAQLSAEALRVLQAGTVSVPRHVLEKSLRQADEMKPSPKPAVNQSAPKQSSRFPELG